MNSIPIPKEATSTKGQAIPNCPNLDPENSTYTVPGTGLRFRRECGANYAQGDLGRIPLTRMEDCLNLCAALQVSVQSFKGRCMGVVWTTPGNNSRDDSYCWLKYERTSGDARLNVEAAWIED